MPDSGLPSVPSNADPALKRLLEAVRAKVGFFSERLTVLEHENRTLQDLLTANAPKTASGNGFRFPEVASIQMATFPNNVRFTFEPFKQRSTGIFITDVNHTVDTPGKRTELWRALEDENSLDAQIINGTTLNVLEDHPPPGVVYRYWLRYASDIPEQTGPFTPVDGFRFVAEEVANPEAQFDALNGGVFLETFQSQNVAVEWTEPFPAQNIPVVTYPPDGIVGGTVAQFAGDEAWRVHNALIPYDPSVLYRMRVGVRFTVAPTNPAKCLFYAGVTGVAADGSTLISSDGQNEYIDQHYIAASAANLIPGGLNSWQTFIGYFSGLGTPTGQAPNIGAPSPLFPGIKYFRPTFIVNYDDGDGVTQVDYVRIEALNPLDISLDVALTLPAIVLPADSGGGVNSYSGAAGTMEVRFGGQILNGNPQLTFSILSNPQALSATINAAGVYAVTAGLDVGEPNATITFRASFHGVNVDRAFYLSKSRDGASSWTPIVDIDSGGAEMLVTPTTLQKVGGGYNWDSSVYSLESFATGAYLSFRAAQTDGYVMVGLNQDPALDASYTSIDFAWYAFPGGQFTIYEGGVAVPGILGTYNTATVFGVTYDGETVRYTKDAVIIREVKAVGRTFAFDSSFYSPAVKIIDLRFGPQASTTNLNHFAVRGNCAYADSTIEKVGGVSAWDSDCYSLEGYTEGAFCSARCNSTSLAAMFGLNTDPLADSSYSSIDFAWYFTGAGSCEIYEGGVGIGSFGAYTTNTVLAIRHVGSMIQYIKGGVVVYSRPYTATSALFFDCSLYHGGVRLEGVRFGPAGKGAEGDPNAVFLETFEEPWPTRFFPFANSGSLISTYPNNGEFGGKVLRAERQLWIAANETIQYNPDFLYRITARIRRIASGAPNEFVYVGVMGVAADGVTLVNQAGSNTYGSQHYNCANGFDMSAIGVNTWKDFVGYFSGHGTLFGVAANVDAPTNLHANVRYFRPLVILNYSGGTGTMECDYLKVERLIVPDDADNTGKRRLVPDGEFGLSSGNQYWWTVLFGSAVAPVISLTGGTIEGKASFSPRSGGTSVAILVSRPHPPQVAVAGEVYTITIRWRRTGSYSSGPPVLAARFLRHDQDGEADAFSATFGSDYQLGAGALIVPADTSFTVNEWQEYSAIVSVPDVNTGLTSLALRYLSVWIECFGGTTGDAAIEVDYVFVSKGAVSAPNKIFISSSGPHAISREDLFSELVYTNTGAATFNLPDATYWPGARVYITNDNIGALTVAYPGGTLVSSPNTTGGRNLAGRYAKSYAEWIGSNTWRLIGQLA